MSKSILLDILRPLGRFLKAYWPALAAFSTSTVISVAIIIHSIQFSIHRNPEEWFLLASLFIANEVAFLALPYVALMNKKTKKDWVAGIFLYLISISPSTLEVSDIIVPKIEKIQTSTYVSDARARSPQYNLIMERIDELKADIKDKKSELAEAKEKAITEEDWKEVQSLKESIRGLEWLKDQKANEAKPYEDKYQQSLDKHETTDETSKKSKSSWVSNTLIWWEVALRILMIPGLQLISLLFLVHGPELMLKGSEKLKKWNEEEKINISIFDNPQPTSKPEPTKDRPKRDTETFPIEPVAAIQVENPIPSEDKKHVIGVTYHKDPTKVTPSTSDIIKDRLNRQQEQKEKRIVKGEVGQW